MEDMYCEKKENFYNIYLDKTFHEKIQKHLIARINIQTRKIQFYETEIDMSELYYIFRNVLLVCATEKINIKGDSNNEK